MAKLILPKTNQAVGLPEFCLNQLRMVTSMYVCVTFMCVCVYVCVCACMCACSCMCECLYLYIDGWQRLMLCRAGVTMFMQL